MISIEGVFPGPRVTPKLTQGLGQSLHSYREEQKHQHRSQAHQRAAEGSRCAEQKAHGWQEERAGLGVLPSTAGSLCVWLGVSA